MTQRPRYSKKAAETLSTALRGYDEDWLMCRDVRHAWQVENNYYVDQTTGLRATASIRRDLVCMRCGTGRIERYVHTRWGLEKTSNTYGYPDGYQIKGVPRGVKPQALVQAEHYRRAMEQVAADEQESDRRLRSVK